MIVLSARAVVNPPENPEAAITPHWEKIRPPLSRVLAHFPNGKKKKKCALENRGTST